MISGEGLEVKNIVSSGQIMMHTMSVDIMLNRTPANIAVLMWLKMT
jgi:hypothetical protein